MPPDEQPPAGGPEETCRVLLAHGVDFVLIGGVAINLHGILHPTDDLDLLFRLGEENIARLGQALVELGAHAVDDPAVRFDPAVDLDELSFWDANAFETQHGRVDCLRAAPGAWDYDAVRRRAATLPLGAAQVAAAALRDLIAMKRAAARDKDLAILPALRRLRATKRRRSAP